MLLLSRPPYLRWLAASVIVVTAVAWDLSARATAPHPFATRAIAAGTVITEDHIEWRHLPRGTLELPDLDAAAWAAVDIAAGDPILSTLVTGSERIPEDWWAVPMRVPPGLGRGAPVRLLLPDGRLVDGYVSVPASDDVFGGPTGAVAVSPERLRDVAAAAAADLVTVVAAP